MLGTGLLLFRELALLLLLSAFGDRSVGDEGSRSRWLGWLFFRPVRILELGYDLSGGGTRLGDSGWLDLRCPACWQAITFLCYRLTQARVLAQGLAFVYLYLERFRDSGSSLLRPEGRGREEGESSDWGWREPPPAREKKAGERRTVSYRENGLGVLHS